MKPRNARSRFWFICDAGVCLYEEAAVERLKRSPIDDKVRCRRHAAVLETDPAYEGLTREEAKRKLEAL